jgi:hypothetical protein
VRPRLRSHATPEHACERTAAQIASLTDLNMKSVACQDPKPSQACMALGKSYGAATTCRGSLLALGNQWREGGWCKPTLFLNSMPLCCCGLGWSWGLQPVAASCFWGVCDHSGCPRSGAALIQQWHLLLVEPPPAVCEMIWRVVVLAAIWAIEQGRKRL